MVPGEPAYRAVGQIIDVTNDEVVQTFIFGPYDIPAKAKTALTIRLDMALRGHWREKTPSGLPRYDVERWVEVATEWEKV